MSETALIHEVMKAISAKGHKIFRTNVGKVRMRDGRWFDTGLPKGYSDLCGTKKGGRAFYIETKLHPRKPTKEQVQFLLTMIKTGAIGGVAYSAEEALKIIEWDDDYAKMTVHALEGMLLCGHSDR